jgi:hypothetical protein
MKLKDLKPGDQFTYSDERRLNMGLCKVVEIHDALTVTRLSGENLRRLVISSEGVAFSPSEDAEVFVPGRGIASTDFLAKPREKKRAPDEKIFHLPIEDNDRISHVTLVFKRKGRGWTAGAAMCAHGDQFSRPVGRALARVRADEKGEWSAVGKGSQEPTYEEALGLAQRFLDKLT